MYVRRVYHIFLHDIVRVMLPLHRVVVLLLFVNPAAPPRYPKESRRDNFLPGPFRDWIRLLCFADTVKPEEVGRKDLLTWHPAHWTASAMAEAADLNHSSLLNQ